MGCNFFGENDAEFLLVVDERGAEAVFTKASLKDVCELFDVQADDGGFPETLFAPFAVDGGDGLDVPVAEGFEEGVSFLESGYYAAHQGVDGLAVGVFLVGAVVVLGYPAEPHQDTADVVLDFKRVFSEGSNVAVDFFPDGLPVFEGGGVVGVGDQMLVGSNLGHRGPVKGGVAAGNGHTAQQGKVVLACYHCYESVFVCHCLSFLRGCLVRRRQ